MPEVTDLTHQEAAGEIKRLLSEYRQAEDLINIGAYQPGSNPVVDRAINKIDLINDFLRQGINEKADYKDTVSQLIEIAR